MRTARSLLLMTLILGANARVVVAGELQPPSHEVKTVLVLVHGSMRPALWLTGQDHGWTVPLPYAADDACWARLHDISPKPLPQLHHSEPMPRHQATLTLRRPRYTGEHTYRISFHCRSSLVADLLVHLDPSAEERRSWRVLPRRLASRE